MSFEKIFSSNKKKTLDKALEKSRTSFFSKITRTFAGKSTIDETSLDELEEVLISSDVGVETSLKIIAHLEERVKKDKYLNTHELNNIIREEIITLLNKNDVQHLSEIEQHKPYVLLVVGVNGVGKTTTIGKLASQFKLEGKKVMIGAADTFRAAAVEQIKTWGKRAGVEVVEKSMGADPASVAFETVKKGKEEGFDLILIDTAGRLHNKVNLMNELTKIKNVIKKFIPEAPHEVMLIVDGTTGQNAFNQTREFSNTTQVSSLTVTKLDGTAKGGVVIGISDQFNIPIKYIGVGERIEDLQRFNKDFFVESFFR